MNTRKLIPIVAGAAALIGPLFTQQAIADDHSNFLLWQHQEEQKARQQGG